MISTPGPGSTWWPSVTVVDPPRALALGERMAVAVRTPLGYRLRVRLTITDVVPGQALAASSAGDLHGGGRVEVSAAGDDASVITIHWDVATRRRWMNATALALRPVFEWAHAHVMKQGERGMRAAVASR